MLIHSFNFRPTPIRMQIKTLTSYLSREWYPGFSRFAISNGGVWRIHCFLNAIGEFDRLFET